MLRFEVKNFGPIAQGAVDLKPLTIFTGKNNSGKSYMAMLIYAVLRTQTSRHFSTWPLPFYDEEEMQYFLPYGIIKSWPGWREWVKKAMVGSTSDKIRNIALPPDSVLGRIKELTLETTAKLSDLFAKALSHELQRCYATKVSELKCQREPEDGLFLSLKCQDLCLRLSCSNGTLKALKPEATITDELVQKALEETVKKFEQSPIRIRDTKQFSDSVLTNTIFHIYIGLARELWLRTYYLPAARSGILQSHKALSSYIVSRSPLAGIEDMEIPKFSGVIADFLSSLQRLEKRKLGKLNELAKYLESEVTKGDIEFKVDEHHYPEIFYGTHVGRFALHRTSSMVSEVAPLVLFLRYIVNPGDIIIIEEPEAHLHPDNQRKMAKALVGLVRSKVKVIITTHSDYLVQQLSNFVALSKLGKDDRVKFGYQSEEYLDADDVGAYLFKFDEKSGGSVIQPIEVKPEVGIDTEEFGKVAEELYEQSVNLQEKVLRDK